MIFNVIICEDIVFFNNSYQNVIHKIEKFLNIRINIYSFKEFNEDFLKLINSELDNKIFILDLFMPHMEGTEIAKMIREIDLVSFIIFITSYYDEYQEEIIDSEYCYLKYINKLDDYQQILFDTLVRNIKKKYQLDYITVLAKEQLFHIVPHSITQIYTDGRKIVLESTVSEDPMLIPISLKKMKSQLPSYFEYSKNCCLVNTKRIINIDKENKIITFDNRTTTNLVSRLYLNGLLNKFKENKKEPSRS